MLPRMLKASIALFFISLSSIAFAEEVRDYYSEPGLHPFKETQGQDQSEQIDPFSGTLQLQYTDIRVPGNGGMDIVIHRNYTNLQKTPGYYNIYGIGWQMGYGRIVVSTGYQGTICGLTNAGNTLHNPSVEHPDGARELLAYNDISNNGGDGSLITKSNWRAKCITANTPTDGMLVTAPDGTKYTMNVASLVYTSTGTLVEYSYFTSRVEDVYGNWIALEYNSLPNRGASQQKYLTRITAGTSAGPDGRQVTFDYIDQINQPISPSSLDIRLAKITNHLSNQNDQVWNYSYTEAMMASSIPNMYGLKAYQLTQVTRPDGTSWQYTYFPEIVDIDNSDSLSVKTVKHPQGGVVTYDYQLVHFYTWTTASSLATHSLYTKTTSGPNITAGTWRYEFLPASFTVAGHASAADVTNVYRPDGTRERHYFYGHSYAIGYYDLLWLIGLEFQKDTFDATNNLIETVKQNWISRRISAQYYLQGIGSNAPDGTDRATWAPLLSYKFISRYDGDVNGFSVTYSNFDKFGNPATITAPAAINSYADKVTQLTYFNDETKWIIGKADTESIGGVTGNVDRTFNGFGSVLSENRYGVLTSYAYSANGDIASTTDALTHITYFDNYYRGIAQLERKPEDNIRTVRTIYDSGMVHDYSVTSTSDTRDLTKHFSYDNLNRLNAIDFRLGSDVTVVWTGAQQRTLTRGNYEEQAFFDGFGRQVKQVRKDKTSGSTITTIFNYDAFGRKIFESYPNSTTKGVTYSYNALNDIRRIDYPNGDYRSYVYVNELQTQITDGRGNTISYLYNCNGLPDMDRTLYSTITALNTTISEHNLLNQPTQIFQGIDDGTGAISGWGRQFSYDTRNYLASETDPEIQTLNTTNTLILYERDNLGNMTKKTIGDTAPVIYQYDTINRLKKIDFASTNDVNFVYSKTGKQKSIDNTLSTRSYIYDDNDNLTDEIVAISGNSFPLHYAVDSLDAVSSITYPSGRVVTLTPDALGRPSRVGNYISAVTYHPSGQWNTLTYGNGRTATATLDPNRLWIDRLTVGGSSALVDLDYQYDTVGNITGIVNAITSSDTRTLGYDSLNRLTSAQGSWGTDAVTYDGLDNISTKAGNTYNYNAQLLQQIQRPGNIRTFFEYDNKARVKEEYIFNYSTGFFGYRNSYTIDEADNITQVDRSLNNGVPTSYSYAYDGKSNRVKRVLGSSTIYYVYADDGTLLGEYPSSTATAGKEYMYLGSQLVASIEPNQAPIANAGSAQNVTGGNTVTLNGSASADPDGTIAAYAWIQLSGTKVTLNNSTTVNPTFTAPSVLGTRPLTFRLTVTDDSGVSASSNVTITNTFTAPDTDGDGMHDAYETANGLNPNNAADANQDLDGDGISNLNEYLQGSNPKVDEANNRDTPFLPPWAMVLMALGLVRVAMRKNMNRSRRERV